jgi:deoxyribonuclease V
MIACVDVGYRSEGARAACVVFEAWADPVPAATYEARLGDAADYRPGQLYLRELPPIMAVLAKVKESVTTVVVDGYVWLGAARPGLGARLHEALDGRSPVVGVAKTAWHGWSSMPPTASSAPQRTLAITRGGSKAPLFVTAAGLDVASAALAVMTMHGPYRMPTLLRLVDQLSRGRR